MEKVIIKCMEKKNYIWNIKTNNEPHTYDSEIFSISLYQEHYNIINKFFDIVGKNIYDLTCTPMFYFRKEYQKIYLNLTKNKDNILINKFSTNISLMIYNILHNIKPVNNTKYLIFATNHYVLDGLLYYVKYKTSDNTNNIVQYSPINPSEETNKYIRKNNITLNMIDKMDTNGIKLFINKINDNLDIIFIDLILGIDKNLENFRYVLLIQSILSSIIFSLHKLNIGGRLIINVFVIPNKMTYNLLSYIGCFFKKVYMSRYDSNITSTGLFVSNFMIFDNFKGIDDDSMDKLIKLNNLMFEYDNTGGYKFNITDEKILNIFNIKKKVTDEKNNKYATTYITNIIDINNPEIENEYIIYKEYMRELSMSAIRNYTQRISNYYLRDNENEYKIICKTAKIIAIYLAKKYKLPLLEWVEEIPENYINKHLTQSFKNMSLSNYSELIKVDDIKLKSSKIVKCDYCPELDKTKMISEIAYQYIENNNFDKYKSIELYINGKYKKLNKLLQTKYKININGQYVSRAWIKFQELLHDTKLLEGFEDNKEVKVFHICEAPGNFINSMDHFIKTKTNIKNYNWNAQSLSKNLRGLDDQYGFIDKTQERWDMGPNKNGDILDEENMKYYLQKYKDVDFLISDCGATWEQNLPDNKNINIHQFFYALLIPGTGGGFVIKTFTMKYNTIILCLLYIACYIYGSVQLFKSNTNFWSFEIYIIGKHKKEVTPEMNKAILKFLDDVTNLNNIYPIDEIPNSFVKNYEKIILNTVSYVADINKFLVFLASNDDIYETIKPKLDKLISVKLDEWLKKYIL